MAKALYNPASARSILKHGEALLGHSLKELHDDAVIFNGKGGLGTSVEFFHYGYEPNSDAEPDFKEAGLELKCTPLKLLADNSMAAKERLVLNIINYIEEAEKSFETSSFWHKNKFLLLMFYLHQSGVNPVDMLFKLIRTWKFPNEDLKIITDDWNIIHNKILSGHAHELTEGETFYLAPCMKGSRAGEEMREQPFSDIPTQQVKITWKSLFNLPMLSNRYLNSCLMLLVSVLLYPLLGVLLLGTCLSNKFHNLGTSTLGSLAYGNTNILEAIQSRTHRLRLLVRLAYEALQQKVLKVFAGRSLLNPPHAIFVIKEKLALADTRIADVARMLKTTMLRVEIPPVCGNDATAYTHPAFVFNIGMCNQKFAEFNRCNPIHRK